MRKIDAQASVRDSFSPKSIVVIQTAFLGDIALTTPFFVALRNRWPGVKIHVVTTPQGTALLSAFDGLVLHSLDKKGQGFFQGLRRILSELQSAEPSFDLTFCVHRSFRSLLIAKKIAARRTIAFRSFWSQLFGFETVFYPPYREDLHYSDKPMALLSAFAGKTATPKPYLALGDSDRLAVDQKLKSLKRGRYWVMSPFSVWGTKMWLADRFARVAADLKIDLPVVIVGGDSQFEVVTSEAIAEKIRASGRSVLNLVGNTSIGELKAVIAGAQFVVTNDSAPVHIAAAFNVPTVAIFGPTVKKWGFFPTSERSVVVERVGLECRPCHVHGPQKCPKGHFRCMNEIEVEDVVQAVQNLMKT